MNQGELDINGTYYIAVIVYEWALGRLGFEVVWSLFLRFFIWKNGYLHVFPSP